MRAKISDLGVAKIAEANPNRMSTMTKTPGTQCYMPPETMVPKPRYSIKVDIFSYGVMMMHVLSGQWPFPGEAVQVNPNNPSDVIGVTEFDRREEYINLIGVGHPLMTLIQECLSNSPSHRPTSSEVHQRVSAVAADHPPSFTNRVEMMERIKALSDEKERIIMEKDNAIGEKNSEIAEMGREKDTVTREKESISAELHVEETQSTIESLCKSHSVEVESLQIVIADMRADMEHLQATIKAKDALVSSKSSTIQSLQIKLGQALGTTLNNKDNFNVFSPGIKLTFTKWAKMPLHLSGLDQGTVIGKNVYVGVDSDGRLSKYSITEETWNTLPVAPVKYARIGLLHKNILLVGGRLPSKEVIADIHEFNEASQQWVRSTSISPMPTARSSATAVSWSSPPALIVCGGNDQQGQPTAVVEVFHSRTSQWHAVSPLPFPRASMTHTVILNMLYLVGGREGTDKETYKKAVTSISIPQLLETCLQPSPTQWQSLPIPNVPNYLSTAASLGGCLLAVGGVKNLTYPPNPDSVVSSVYAYCPFTTSWVLVGELPQPFYMSITATLPTGELLVIGGRSHSGSVVVATNRTYKCSLSM